MLRIVSGIFFPRLGFGFGFGGGWWFVSLRM